jgi:hypothetical protein
MSYYDHTLLSRQSVTKFKFMTYKLGHFFKCNQAPAFVQQTSLRPRKPVV